MFGCRATDSAKRAVTQGQSSGSDMTTDADPAPGTGRLGIGLPCGPASSKPFRSPYQESCQPPPSCAWDRGSRARGIQLPVSFWASNHNASCTFAMIVVQFIANRLSSRCTAIFLPSGKRRGIEVPQRPPMSPNDVSRPVGDSVREDPGQQIRARQRDFVFDRVPDQGRRQFEGSIQCSKQRRDVGVQCRPKLLGHFPARRPLPVADHVARVQCHRRPYVIPLDGPIEIGRRSLPIRYSCTVRSRGRAKDVVDAHAGDSTRGSVSGSECHVGSDEHTASRPLGVREQIASSGPRIRPRRCRRPL